MRLRTIWIPLLAALCLLIAVPLAAIGEQARQWAAATSAVVPAATAGLGPPRQAMPDLSYLPEYALPPAIGAQIRSPAAAVTGPRMDRRDANWTSERHEPG